jgi:hypothetical protein
MKLRLTLKDPDGVYEMIQEAAENQVEQIEGLNDDEKESLIESRREKISEQLQKWIEYGEYVHIEFDLETKTATVLTK